MANSIEFSFQKDITKVNILINNKVYGFLYNFDKPNGFLMDFTGNTPDGTTLRAVGNELNKKMAGLREEYNKLTEKAATKEKKTKKIKKGKKSG